MIYTDVTNRRDVGHMNEPGETSPRSMSKIAIIALKLTACYLVAGAAYLLYVSWPHYEGHPHIPFSDFPAFLVFSPVAPLMLFEEVAIDPRRAWPGALVLGTVLVGGLWIIFRKRRIRKKASVGGFAWALLFLSGGRMPPPPPQSQIEQEAGERKNREIGRSDD